MDVHAIFCHGPRCVYDDECYTYTFSLILIIQTVDSGEAVLFRIIWFASFFWSNGMHVFHARFGDGSFVTGLPYCKSL